MDGQAMPAPELAELVDLHQQAAALAPNDPEAAHAARHLAYAIGLRTRSETKAHGVLQHGAPML